MEFNKTKSIQGDVLIRYAPLIIILIYFITTIALFKYGPWDWPVKNQVKLYLFLFLFILAITSGYIFGSHSKVKYRGRIKKNKLRFFLLIFAIFIPLTSYSRIGIFIPSFDISNLMNNLGDNYYSNNLQGNIVLIEYFRIMLSPILIALPILIFTTNFKYKSVIRAIMIIMIINVVLIDVNRGQNRQIIDYFLIIGLSTLINIFKSKYNKISKVKFRFSMKKIAIVISVILFFCLFLIMFGNSMEQRNSSLNNSYAGISMDLNNQFLYIFPTDFLKITVGKLISYITQGYYGLSIALEKQFEWTLGFGYSTFLINNFDQIFHTNIIDNAYYSKTIDSGWPTGIVWSSAFVFFASDLTFFGTIILYFFISFGLAKSWKESIEHNNNISTVFFYLLFVLLIYTPANNQMFQLGENFVAFWYWFILWVSYPILLKIFRK